MTYLANPMINKFLITIENVCRRRDGFCCFKLLPQNALKIGNGVCKQLFKGFAEVFAHFLEQTHVHLQNMTTLKTFDREKAVRWRLRLEEVYDPLAILNTAQCDVRLSKVIALLDLEVDNITSQWQHESSCAFA